MTKCVEKTSLSINKINESSICYFEQFSEFEENH